MSETIKLRKNHKVSEMMVVTYSIIIILTTWGHVAGNLTTLKWMCKGLECLLCYAHEFLRTTDRLMPLFVWKGHTWFCSTVKGLCMQTLCVLKM
jgi:hypothetical protein